MVESHSGIYLWINGAPAIAIIHAENPAQLLVDRAGRKGECGGGGGGGAEE